VLVIFAVSVVVASVLSAFIAVTVMMIGAYEPFGVLHKPDYLHIRVFRGGYYVFHPSVCRAAYADKYIAFAYPATIRDVSKVTYVEANDGSMASSFTKETIDVADARGGENGKKSYKVYAYKMAVPATAGMTFDVII
jgi:hypothetical protein